MNPLELFGMFDFRSVPVVISRLVPLESWRRLKSDAYDEIIVKEPKLCMLMGGRIYVHPDRWPLIAALGGEFSRSCIRDPAPRQDEPCLACDECRLHTEDAE